MDARPALAEEYDEEASGRPLNTITTGMHFLGTWKCKDCGNCWEAKVYNRVSGSSCPQPECRLKARKQS